MRQGSRIISFWNVNSNKRSFQSSTGLSRAMLLYLGPRRRGQGYMMNSQRLYVQLVDDSINRRSSISHQFRSSLQNFIFLYLIYIQSSIYALFIFFFFAVLILNSFWIFSTSLYSFLISFLPSLLFFLPSIFHSTINFPLGKKGLSPLPPPPALII